MGLSQYHARRDFKKTPEPDGRVARHKGKALSKTHGSKYGGKAEAWLLIKDTDEYARRGEDARIVDAEPDSAASGRSLEDIARANDHEWHSNRSVKENVRTGAVGAVKQGAVRKGEAKSGKPVRKTSKSGPAGVTGARLAPLPAALSPPLCTLVDAPPKGKDWIHEVKYDGYRLMCRLEDGEVRIFTRSGKDWTDRFGKIAAGIKRLKAKSAWIDGELCAIDQAGRSSFQSLQNALSSSNASNLVFFAFDLPCLNGYDLKDVVLTERKRLLAQLLKRPPAMIRYSPEVRGSGAAVFRQACSLSLEGIVSKRSDSTYSAGVRTRNWIKVKCELRQEMVIGGFTDPQGSRAGFGALLLGVYEDGKLRYAGKVGTGFDDALLETMRAQLNKLETKTAPFVNPPRGYEAKGAHWIEPRLVAEVKFTEWSDTGALRHPAFVGLREDKMATEVVREKTGPTAAAPAASKAKIKAKEATRQSNVEAQGDTVAGVKLSHPDKLLYPEAGLSKLSLARYYESIADWILPHLKNRPLSLVRCPDGWNKECFYQKHADKSVHAAVSRVEVPEGGGTATYFAANTLPALIGLVQWGVTELHPWGSRSPNPEKPDRLIFDFDPADDVTWHRLVEAVHTLKTLLDDLGLAAFLKTTGGKGLHVVVPIKRTLSWAEAKDFSKAIADLLSKTFPDRYLASLSKSKRTGRIFIDYLRNAEGATAIGPYAIRSRKNAPVSTPIEWKELEQDVRFDYFNVKNVPARLAKLRQDPWEAIDTSSRTVTAAMFTRVGARKP